MALLGCLYSIHFDVSFGCYGTYLDVSTLLVRDLNIQSLKLLVSQ